MGEIYSQNGYAPRAALARVFNDGDGRADERGSGVLADKIRFIKAAVGCDAVYGEGSPARKL